ncbi:MAG: helix-turn-helix transcriptional regulator [Caulobacteraceae bacterium]|nr:helix-turn-helix transcriptional regulator [Caulobacteraceae bacterium]
MADFDDNFTVIAPCQCRAARALLGWTQDELAEAAGHSRSTVKDFENGRHHLHRSTAGDILGALRRHGVTLIRDASGLGVKLAAG